MLAGAGSGKTKTLLQKLVYLIEEKSISPSSILAITFTKNAANEMIDRLIMTADQSGTFRKTISDKDISAPAKDQDNFQVEVFEENEPTRVYLKYGFFAIVRFKVKHAEIFIKLKVWLGKLNSNDSLGAINYPVC